MEYLKVAEAPKREYRTSRTRNQRTVRSNLLESAAAKIKSGSVVSNAEECDGGMRVKIVVKKGDLKQMLEAIRAGKSNMGLAAAPSASALCLEQRLNVMRRRQQWRGSSRRCGWRPALHSIPEEV